MAMAGLQRQVSTIVHRILSPLSSRAHHSLSKIPQHHSCMEISAPRIVSQPETALEVPRVDNFGDCNAIIRNPFLDLLAVPKRKVRIIDLLMSCNSSQS